MAKVNGTKVITNEVRFSYANVFVPKAIEQGQDPKYSVNILISKEDTETVDAVKAAIAQAKADGLQSKWGGKLPKKFHEPLRDGDEERDDDPVYKNHYFINISSKNKPGVIDRYKNELTSDDEFYSGCYGRASINFFPFNSAGNNGIGAGLNNLQKLRDGERLAGRASAEDDFDEDFSGSEDDLDCLG